MIIKGKSMKKQMFCQPPFRFSIQVDFEGLGTRVGTVRTIVPRTGEVVYCMILA